MKSIVRKDTSPAWKEYLQGLARAEGIESPTDEQLRRLDRRRKGKKVSNQDWKSATDADSRSTKMKDRRTHLANNLGLFLRKGWGSIKPRGLAGLGSAAC